MVRKVVSSINGFLQEATPIAPRKHALCRAFPKITVGDVFGCGGNLILSEEERTLVLRDSPTSEVFIKPYITGRSLISGNHDFCLSIDDGSIKQALEIPFIQGRLDKVSAYRKNSPKPSTASASEYPWRYLERRHEENKSVLLLPVTSSYGREYFPSWVDHTGGVPSVGLHLIYENVYEMLSITSSRLYSLWLFNAGTTMKKDRRHGIATVYNTFPYNGDGFNDLYSYGLEIDRCRIESGESYKAIYESGRIPSNLRKAHMDNDRAVDKVVLGRECESDADRLRVLLDTYEELAENLDEGPLMQPLF